MSRMRTTAFRGSRCHTPAPPACCANGAVPPTGGYCTLGGPTTMPCCGEGPRRGVREPWMIPPRAMRNLGLLARQLRRVTRVLLDAVNLEPAIGEADVVAVAAVEIRDDRRE